MHTHTHAFMREKKPRSITIRATVAAMRWIMRNFESHATGNLRATRVGCNLFSRVHARSPRADDADADDAAAAAADAAAGSGGGGDLKTDSIFHPTPLASSFEQAAMSQWECSVATARRISRCDMKTLLELAEA